MLSPVAETLQATFLAWTLRKGNPPRAVNPSYALYHRFFTTLPRPEEFWESLAASPMATAFGPHYRFMAAVKHLLLKGATDPLRNLYPELASGSAIPYDALPGKLFQDVCAVNWERIIALATSRDVQINKVGRCALFMPLFAEAHERAGRKPLAMIEVGASAGFGMLWPYKIGYDYGSRGRVGIANTRMVLHCQVHGRKAIRIPAALLPWKSRSA